MSLISKAFAPDSIFNMDRKLENLSKMLALRVVRANREWEHYWSGAVRKAA
jgi:hypothetical protein